VAATTATRSDDAAAQAAASQQRPKSRWWLSLLGGLATVGVCVAGVLRVSSGEPAAAASIRPPVVGAAVAATGEPGLTAPADLLYRDGRYTATGHYLTPGGNESIAVSVDVNGDTVTASVIEVEAKSPTARQFQEQFRTTIAGHVTAKPLSTLSVTRVSGASLTSLGFDDALAKIRQEAKN
jgi:uncharacterized protein with FMN-binding domain